MKDKQPNGQSIIFRLSKKNHDENILIFRLETFRSQIKCPIQSGLIKHLFALVFKISCHILSTSIDGEPMSFGFKYKLHF